MSIELVNYIKKNKIKLKDMDIGVIRLNKSGAAAIKLQDLGNGESYIAVLDKNTNRFKTMVVSNETFWYAIVMVSCSITYDNSQEVIDFCDLPIGEVFDINGSAFIKVEKNMAFCLMADEDNENYNDNILYKMKDFQYIRPCHLLIEIGSNIK